jgi:hypothetical protein
VLETRAVAVLRHREVKVKVCIHHLRLLRSHDSSLLEHRHLNEVLIGQGSTAVTQVVRRYRVLISAWSLLSSLSRDDNILTYSLLPTMCAESG